MRLRSGRILTMPGDGDGAKGMTMVSHTLTNYKSGIEPFAGRVNGELKQGVEVFIESIENHFESRGIDDDHDRYIEAKSHFNLSQGDLGDCTRSIFFRDCRTWTDLKSFLRSTYGSGEHKDLVLDLRRVMKLHNRDGNSFVAQNARINDGIIDFCTSLQNSNWADKDNGRAISINRLGRLLQLAIGTLSLPDNLINSFDEGFSPTSTERDIMSQITKHIGKLPVGDSTILGGTSKESKSVRVVAKSQDNSSRVDRSYQPQQSVSSGTHVQKRVFKCYNCNREGHVKKDCHVRFCGFHQSTSHNWKDCKAIRSNTFYQPRNRSQSGDRRYRNSSTSRNESYRWNKNSRSSRSSSPSKSNFQRTQQKGGKG